MANGFLIYPLRLWINLAHFLLSFFGKNHSNHHHGIHGTCIFASTNIWLICCGMLIGKYNIHGWYQICKVGIIGRDSVMIIKLDHFPRIGVKINNIWNHHLPIFEGPTLQNKAFSNQNKGHQRVLGISIQPKQSAGPSFVRRIAILKAWLLFLIRWFFATKIHGRKKRSFQICQLQRDFFSFPPHFCRCKKCFVFGGIFGKMFSQLKWATKKTTGSPTFHEILVG